MSGSTALYYPFGDWRTEPTAGLTDRGFTGHLHDNTGSNDIGLIYMQARFYLPGVGRFISADTIVPNPANPQNYNRYSYVLNNPLLLMDPSGHIECGNEFMPEEGDCDENGGWASPYTSGKQPPQSGGALGSNTDSGGDAVLPLVPEPTDALTAVYYYVYSLYYNQFCPGGHCINDTFGGESPELTLYFLAVDNVNESLENTGLSPLGLLSAYLAGEVILETGAMMVLDAYGKPVYNAPCSFSYDTLVTTEDGLVPIGELKIGDYVLAYNEETGKIAYYPITATWAHQDPVIMYLTINGETIETTPNHPFYTVDGEWVFAGSLAIGDKIRNSTWGIGKVEAISFLAQPQFMYNLTVATAHTYFVGDGQWLVHNLNCDTWAKKLGLNPNSQTTQQLYQNRSMSVQEYTSRFRLGSIKGRLPTSALEMSVEEALRVNKVDGVSVRKLLIDSRFIK